MKSGGHNDVGMKVRLLEGKVSVALYPMQCSSIE